MIARARTIRLVVVCAAVAAAHAFAPRAHAAPESSFGLATRGLSIGADGTWWLPAAGDLSIGLRSNAEGFVTSGSSPSARGEALTCLGWSRSNATVWLGAGAWRPSAPELRATRAMVAGGTDVRWRTIRWSTSARRLRTAQPQDPYLVLVWVSPPYYQSPPDVIPTVPYWEYPTPIDVSVTTFETALEWRRARWDVAGGLGVSIGKGFGPVHLGRVALTRWVAPSLGLRVGGQAAAPRWLTGEPSDKPRYELGVAFQPGRKAPRDAPAGAGADGSAGAAGAQAATAPIPRWEIDSRGDGLYALRVHAPGARAVTLRGDFTDWEWIALEPVGAGWWAATRALGAGAHQVEIAADGLPAPLVEGLARGASDYGREVGVFVVE